MRFVVLSNDYEAIFFKLIESTLALDNVEKSSINFRRNRSPLIMKRPSFIIVNKISLKRWLNSMIKKCFLEVASAYQASLLVVEGSQLAGLVHANIASLAAACLDNPCPLLAYASAPSELNLKTYLTDGNHHPVTRDLVNIGAQVARAGAFLHGRGLLHR